MQNATSNALPAVLFNQHPHGPRGGEQASCSTAAASGRSGAPEAAAGPHGCWTAASDLITLRDDKCGQELADIGVSKAGMVIITADPALLHATRPPAEALQAALCPSWGLEERAATMRCSCCAPGRISAPMCRTLPRRPSGFTIRRGLFRYFFAHGTGAGPAGDGSGHRGQHADLPEPVVLPAPPDTDAEDDRPVPPDGYW